MRRPFYEKLLKDYPTDPIVPAAQLQLAFCFYFLGQFDEALDVLKKAGVWSAMSAELKQTLDGLVPQILSGKSCRDSGSRSEAQQHL